MSAEISESIKSLINNALEFILWHWIIGYKYTLNSQYTFVQVAIQTFAKELSLLHKVAVKHITSCDLNDF